MINIIVPHFVDTSHCSGLCSSECDCCQIALCLYQFIYVHLARSMEFASAKLHYRYNWEATDHIDITHYRERLRGKFFDFAPVIVTLRYDGSRFRLLLLLLLYCFCLARFWRWTIIAKMMIFGNFLVNMGKAKGRDFKCIFFRLTFL